MREQVGPAVRMLLIMTLLTGVFYPLVVTGLAQVLFPRQASGSFVERHGVRVGSELIGQRFTEPGHFHGRPSAAGHDGYDAAMSGGSNLGPTSRELVRRVSRDVQRFREGNPAYRGAIPADLLTTSGSGLDPHISPGSALAQVERVAAARAVSPAGVRELVLRHVEGRQLGFLGEPRVNVLRLNLDLDEWVVADRPSRLGGGRGAR